MASHSKSHLLEVVYPEPPLEAIFGKKYLADIDRMKPYRRLESPRLIRLVILEPGDWGSPISCRLDCRSLADKSINYVALSYAWGAPKITRPVLVDGIELEVTVNLESALRHLRRQSEPLAIWVDAIVSEHFISAVVTFYGDDRDDEQVAGFLERWSIPRPSAKYTAIDIFCFVRLLTLQNHSERGFALLHPLHMVGVTEALRMMLLSQWWTRMWVFQEVIVASRVTFQYGGVEAPLGMFTKAALCLQDPDYKMPLKSDLATVLRHYSKILGDIAYWRGFWAEKQSRHYEGTSSELLALLRATATRKASDDRDRVFALLGLVRTSLVPNYALSTARVFMSVCWNSIQVTGTLEALCGDLGRKNRSDLPTWTADWSAIVHESDKLRMTLPGKYNASGGQKARVILDTGKTLAKAIELYYKMDGLLLVPPWAEGMFESLGKWKPDWSRPDESKEPANIYNFLLKSGICQFKSAHTGCEQQDISLIYEQPSGGRLCGYARPVSTVQSVNEPVYEPIGTIAIAQNLKWSVRQEDDNACLNIWSEGGPRSDRKRAMVFDMKHVDGQYQRLQEEDLDALSRWGISHCERAVKGEKQTNDNANHPNAVDELGFDVVFKTLAVRRKAFWATNGNMGWGPLDTQPGDDIHVLPGGRTPFILRRATDEHGIEVFRLIGDCYLQEAMDGMWAYGIKHTCPLGHNLLPALFWSECKNDLVTYFNRSARMAAVSATRIGLEQIEEDRPILRYIDKPGVFDTWLAETLQWASTYNFRLPKDLEDPQSILCEAFRNLEKMPKPPGHITII
ncbi:hypothetical protein PG991_008354 [Apiospora marii]|uniref:Heterokaryon incompatibility domain-containing protein n=1 Tax=Apiospora marii TaxID=335849 RepID=A0ABR1RQM3_9PEZI